MYQAKTGQTPPPELAAARLQFETAQLEQILPSTSLDAALMPRNLTAEQRRAVKAMVSRVNPSL